MVIKRNRIVLTGCNTFTPSFFCFFIFILFSHLPLKSQVLLKNDKSHYCGASFFSSSTHINKSYEHIKGLQNWHWGYSMSYLFKLTDKIVYPTIGLKGSVLISKYLFEIDAEDTNLLWTIHDYKKTTSLLLQMPVKANLCLMLNHKLSIRLAIGVNFTKAIMFEKNMNFYAPDNDGGTVKFLQIMVNTPQYPIPRILFETGFSKTLKDKNNFILAFEINTSFITQISVDYTYFPESDYIYSGSILNKLFYLSLNIGYEF